MSQNFIIRPKIYPFDLMVSIAQTPKQLKKSLAKVGKEFNEDDHCIPGSGRFIMDEDNTGLIILHKLETPEDYGTLHHEIFHYVFAVVERIGAKINSGSEEFVAYFVGYITEKVLRKIIKTHKPRIHNEHGLDFEVD